MKVKVTHCTGRTLYFKLTWGDGQWQNIPGEVWDRKTATKALNVLERIYGLKRASIRFDHCWGFEG